MSGETLVRIEVESLQPGDVFEYYHDRLNRMVRDTVRVCDDTDLPSRRGKHMRQGTDFFKSPGNPMTSVYTQQGENNHGYVTLPAKTIVVLVRENS